MKKSIYKIIKNLVLVSIILMASGCTYYKTLQLSETTKEAIEITNQYKNVIFISDSLGTTQYKLTGMTISDSSISGVISKAHNYHIPHSKSIRKGRASALQMQPLQTMHIYLSEGRFTEGPFATTLDNIHSIEIHETALGKSVAISVGIPVVLSAAAVGVWILLSDCTCPFVESYNTDTSLFHGSLFPGAIFKSIAREDYLELASPSLNQDGILSLRVFNAMPEVEYIDQLELYRVNDNGYENVASQGNGNFIGYNVTQSPTRAISGYVTNVTNQIADEDGVIFNFSNLNQTNELNSLEVTFKKEELSNHPKLTLVGNQSHQLDTVAHYLFSNIGNKYSDWVAKMDKERGAKWTNTQREKGISLHISMKERGKWKSLGYWDNPGALSFRKFALDLDLTNHKDSIVELRFESAYKIWELDQIALSDDYKTNLEVEKIPFARIENQDQLDISESVLKTDEEYHVQNNGEYITLETSVPVDQSTLFLKGSGYYHHSITNDEPPNYALLKQMRHKLSFHELSKSLEQVQKMMAVTQEN